MEIEIFEIEDTICGPLNALVQVNVQFFQLKMQPSVEPEPLRSIVSSVRRRMRRASSIRSSHLQVQQSIKCKSKSEICIRTTISRYAVTCLCSIWFHCISVPAPFKWFIVGPSSEREKIKWFLCDCSTLACIFCVVERLVRVESEQWSKNTLHKWFDWQTCTHFWWPND